MIIKATMESRNDIFVTQLSNFQNRSLSKIADCIVEL